MPPLGEVTHLFRVFDRVLRLNVCPVCATGHAPDTGGPKLTYVSFQLLRDTCLGQPAEGIVQENE